MLLLALTISHSLQTLPPGHSALTLVGCPGGLEAIFESSYNVFSLIAGLLHLKDDLELSYPGCWISSVVVTSDYLAKKEMEEVVGRSGLYKIVLPINAASLFIDENVAHLKRRTGEPLWLQDSLSTVVRL